MVDLLIPPLLGCIKIFVRFYSFFRIICIFAVEKFFRKYKIISHGVETLTLFATTIPAEDN